VVNILDDQACHRGGDERGMERRRGGVVERRSGGVVERN